MKNKNLKKYKLNIQKEEERHKLTELSTKIGY